MIKKTSTYSDLDLSFKPHPLTGDLPPKTDIEAVRRALKTAFFLDKFDIPFEKSKVSSLKRYLFEQDSQITEISIRKNIEWIFKVVEPRANLIKTDVFFDPIGIGYNITVWYNIKSLNLEDNFTFFAQRVR